MNNNVTQQSQQPQSPTSSPNTQPTQQQQQQQQVQTSQPFQSATLYAGDLHPEVTEAYLYEIFREVGPIISIKVCRDVITRKSLGYAYVNFQNPHDAERALDALNYTKVKGKPIRIMWSQRDPSIRRSGVGNIFIKNLDKTIDNKSLYDTFSAFGNILSCKVEHTKRPSKDGTIDSLGYGYIHFETKEAAEQAIAKVNGMAINGKKVYVGHFVKKAERSKGKSQNQFTNIYVNNFPKENFDEKEFSELFSKFGEIQNCAVMRDNEGKSRGFGFINFKDYDAASKAVDEMNEKEIDGKILLVSRAQKKDERKEELKKIYQNRFHGVNLYVKNLDESFDDEKLKETFKVFGEIQNCKVMRDENGISKGFAFVCFSKPEEATKAITEMNGRMLGVKPKPLFVALAQRKDLREAQLKAQRSGIRGPGMHPQPMFSHGTPVFYPQGIPQQRPFVYPQMMRPRWQNTRPPNGPTPFPNQGGMIPPPGVNPFGTGMQLPPNVNQSGLGPHRNQKQRRGGNQQRRGYKYNQQARNKPLDQQQQHIPQQSMQPMQSIQTQQQLPQQQQQPQQQSHQQQQQPQQQSQQLQMIQSPQNSLTPEYLAQCPPQQQKQLLGERLFPLIHLSQPHLASKITGMLLEMDNGDILHLLESDEALHAKISEAVGALKVNETNKPEQVQEQGEEEQSSEQ